VILTRLDKLVYWFMRFAPAGIVHYDWRSDWIWYLRRRESGMTPLKAWLSEDSTTS
jgi:hypothetical protein